MTASRAPADERPCDRDADERLTASIRRSARRSTCGTPPALAVNGTRDHFVQPRGLRVRTEQVLQPRPAVRRSSRPPIPATCSMPAKPHASGFSERRPYSAAAATPAAPAPAEVPPIDCKRYVLRELERSSPSRRTRSRPRPSARCRTARQRPRTRGSFAQLLGGLRLRHGPPPSGACRRWSFFGARAARPSRARSA